MIDFTYTQQRFTYRAAAIILRHSRVLLMRAASASSGSTDVTSFLPAFVLSA